MAQKYSEEQKQTVLARIPEVGVKAAADEAGIPWQTVAKWNKATSNELFNASDNAEDAETAAAMLIKAFDAADRADQEYAAAAREAFQEKKEKIIFFM